MNPLTEHCFFELSWNAKLELGLQLNVSRIASSSFTSESKTKGWSQWFGSTNTNCICAPLTKSLFTTTNHFSSLPAKVLSKPTYRPCEHHHRRHLNASHVLCRFDLLTGRIIRKRWWESPLFALVQKGLCFLEQIKGHLFLVIYDYTWDDVRMVSRRPTMFIGMWSLEIITGSSWNLL